MKTKTLIQTHRAAIKEPFAIIKCERRTASGKYIGRWFVYFDTLLIGLEGRSIDGEIRFKRVKRHDFDSQADMREWWNEVSALPEMAPDDPPEEENDNRFGDVQGVYRDGDEYAECTSYDN